MISSTDLHAAKILVVDDLEPNVMLLEGMLRRAGYTSVSRSMDSTEVCELHRANRYDLILLDLKMPGMDGFEVMEGLKELDGGSFLPVIVLTAQPSQKLRALTAGARDFVGKPFDLAEVLMRVQNHLEVRLLHDEVVRCNERLEVRNKFICETFGRYLSEDIMTSLLDSPGAPTLGGKTRTVTMMMADLRGFTPIAESLPPARVVSIVNNYLSTMIDVVGRHGGTIDAFTGDGIFGLFGAPNTRPDDAERAVACAVAMQLAMVEVNAKNREMGLPTVEMGIGIHTGDVVVGSIGSTQRAKFGVVGSAVNLTARIESYTTGGQVMISQSTLDAVGGAVDVEAPLHVAPKGVSRPISIYSVVGMRGRPELVLTHDEAPLSAPASPLQVRFVLVAEQGGKGSSGEVVEGRIRRLSRDGAEIEAPLAARGFENLELTLVAGGEALPRPLYAKVIGESSDGVFRVRFTSIPPDVETLLDSHVRDADAHPACEPSTDADPPVKPLAPERRALAETLTSQGNLPSDPSTASGRSV